METEVTTLSTAKPLPDGLEELAIAWVEAWKVRDDKAMDKQLSGLNQQKASLVIRRGQRLAEQGRTK